MPVVGRSVTKLSKIFFNNFLELPALIKQDTLHRCSRLMEVKWNKEITVKVSFCTHKEFTKLIGHAGNAAVTVSDVAVTCRYLPIFLWCGALSVMGFRGSIASLFLDHTL